MYPVPLTREILTRAFTASGYEVMAASSSDEAWERVTHEAEPDAAVLHLGDDEPIDDWIGQRLRRDPATRELPVVVLTRRRRVALRAGFADLVAPPFEAEDVVLTLDLVLRDFEDADFTGDLDKLSMPDLLQATVSNGRSGSISVESKGYSGNLWFSDGRVVDASTSTGLIGAEAAYQLITRAEGDFRVDFQTVDRQQRIDLSLNFLLLEAMRRYDEAQTPPHAGLPDEPPAPTREAKALHLGLMLTNVTTSWMRDMLRPQILARRLRDLRDELATDYPQLGRFEIDREAGVAYTGDELTGEQVEPFVDAITTWLRRLFASVEHSLPGRFSLERLAVLTGADRDSLREVGFDRALGWTSPDDNTAPGDPA